LFSSVSLQCPCFGANCWVSKLNIGPSKCSVTNILDKQAGITQYSSPGGFNDLDTLEIGNGGMTFDQYQTHFSLWAVLKSNLILGNDIVNMSDIDLSIISNQELIAINQDPLGKSARLVFRSFHYFGIVPSKDIWFGELSNDRFVVLFFNRNGKKMVDIHLDFQKHLSWSADTKVKVRDVIRHQDIGEFKDSMDVTGLKPFQSRVYVFSNLKRESFKLRKLS
jgi:alpha-galactosidase